MLIVIDWNQLEISNEQIIIENLFLHMSAAATSGCFISLWFAWNINSLSGANTKIDRLNLTTGIFYDFLEIYTTRTWI